MKFALTLAGSLECTVCIMPSASRQAMAAVNGG